MPNNNFPHCPRKDCGIILSSNQIDEHVVEHACPTGHYSARETTGGFVSWSQVDASQLKHVDGLEIQIARGV